MIYLRIGAYDASEPPRQSESDDGGKRASIHSKAIGGAVETAPPHH